MGLEAKSRIPHHSKLPKNGSEYSQFSMIFNMPVVHRTTHSEKRLIPTDTKNLNRKNLQQKLYPSIKFTHYSFSITFRQIHIWSPSKQF